MSEHEIVHRSIEYLDADGRVITKMGTWIDLDSPTGDREPTPEDAQMFYDTGSVQEANGSWLITSWRYEGDHVIHPVERDPDLKPPTADEIIQPLLARFREQVKFLPDLDASVYAIGFASDLARFALASRVDGSSDV